MAKSRGIIQRLHNFKDRNLDAQIGNIIGAARLFPFLGVLAADPTTTGWADKDICWWVNKADPDTILIKYWDGDGVKTITAA